MRRVVVYVDGFNLYYGLRAGYGRRYHWLDLETLAESLLPPQHRLERINYFTARVRNQRQSIHRQAAYLTALAACCPTVSVIEGRFQERVLLCRSCGRSRRTYEEKETDVNIASALIRDAVTDRFDTALLISADADLAPAVATVKQLAPTKRMTVGFPPRRHSDVLSRTCDAAFFVGADKIRAAQLPDKIVLPSGVVLERPPYWR
jgi:uncharacterized LabA/DUF88 family protein